MGPWEGGGHGRLVRWRWAAAERAIRLACHPGDATMTQSRRGRPQIS